MNEERIMVCGLGKLGSCVTAVFSASYFKVTGYDIDEKKVNAIKSHKAPIVETDLDDYLNFPQVLENLTATSDLKEAVNASDACFFVTPTPSMADGSFDHTMLLTAIANVAHAVQEQRKRDYLFVVNSTVMPGFLAGKALPTIGRILDHTNFDLGYKPEFIALGTVIRDMLYPDVLLIGSTCDDSCKRIERIYREMILHDCQARRLSLVEAELAKISLNCAVTMKISFANQVAAVARKLGANPVNVLSSVGFDHRVGHAALRPGLPFGGPCFPRDNRMFQYVAALVNERAPLAEATDFVNRGLLRQVLLEILPHGTVGILGMAYKTGTHITDESAGIYWYKVLRSRGRKVLTHDPMASCLNTLEEVLDCDTVIVACSWPEYKEITVRKSTKVIDLTGETVVFTLPYVAEKQLFERAVS